MGKYILQLAGIGILSLFGWGVDLMPANTSWIPSIVIWGVAIIWLIVITIYYFRRGRRVSYGDGILPITKTKNDYPDIKVKEKISGNRAVLVVSNMGADANFTAEAVIVKGVPPQIRYTMCWDSPPYLEHPIKKGGTSMIIVAEKASPITEDPSIVKGGLLLYQWGISGVEKVGATTEGLRETIMLNMRYPTMAKPVDDSCTIELTITSTPSLISPFANHKYIVKVDHEQKHILLITPLPELVLDKEGSQT